jgi:hypothetical protein
MEQLYNEYSGRHDFDEYFQNDISAGTEIVHAHWDLIMTDPYLRKYVEEDYMDNILDFAAKADATMEVNGRVIAKLRQEFARDESEYEPEDSELFGRKLVSRAAEGEIDYVA